MALTNTLGLNPAKKRTGVEQAINNQPYNDGLNPTAQKSKPVQAIKPATSVQGLNGGGGSNPNGASRGWTANLNDQLSEWVEDDANQVAIEREIAVDDKLGADKLEADRVAADKKMADKKAADKLEANRLATEKIEADRVAGLKVIGNDGTLNYDENGDLIESESGEGTTTSGLNDTDSAMSKTEKILNDITAGLDPVTQRLIQGIEQGGGAKQAAEEAAQRQRMESQGMSEGLQEANSLELQRDLRLAEGEQKEALSAQLYERQTQAAIELDAIEDKNSAEFMDKFNTLVTVTDFSNPESVLALKNAANNAGIDNIDGLIDQELRNENIQAEDDFTAFMINSDKTFINDGYTDGDIVEFAGGKIIASKYDYTDPTLVKHLEDISETDGIDNGWNWEEPENFTTSEGWVDDGYPAWWTTGQKEYADGLMNKQVINAEQKDREKDREVIKSGTAWKNMDEDTQNGLIAQWAVEDELAKTGGYKTVTIGDKTIMTKGDTVAYFSGGDTGDVGKTNNGSYFYSEGGETHLQDGTYIDSNDVLHMADGTTQSLKGASEETLKSSLSGDVLEVANKHLGYTDVEGDDTTTPWKQLTISEQNESFANGNQEAIDQVSNSLRDGVIPSTVITTAMRDDPDLYAKVASKLPEKTITSDDNMGNWAKNRKKFSNIKTGDVVKIGGKIYKVDSITNANSNMLDKAFSGNEFYESASLTDISGGDSYMVNSYDGSMVKQ